MNTWEFGHGTDNDVLIGGFILKGTQPKQLLLRAIGPSLAQYGVQQTLQDPVLELHDSAGNIIMQNDDWQTGGQASAIQATGKAPSDPNEAALIATLNPGTYTAIVRGLNNTQGVALVEGYELDAPSTRLVNVSTRGQIGTADQVLIGGFIVQSGTGKNVIVRALGASLASFLSGVLPDPVLDLYDSNGTLISSNDNWQSSPQAAAISASGQAPSSALDSAIMTTLAPGNYTAIVHGVNNATGIGMVEVYDLE